MNKQTDLDYIEKLIFDLNKENFGINSDDFEFLLDENFSSKENLF
ncbi:MULTISPECIES: hypothetical protein [unclassified Gemella]|nr:MULTISPECIES: hypothetical protein [unclassified Gemella]